MENYELKIQLEKEILEFQLHVLKTLNDSDVKKKVPLEQRLSVFEKLFNNTIYETLPWNNLN
jgi:hypothetical protein